MEKKSFGQWELPHLTKEEMVRFFSKAFLVFLEKEVKKKKQKDKAQ